MILQEAKYTHGDTLELHERTNEVLINNKLINLKYLELVYISKEGNELYTNAVEYFHPSMFNEAHRAFHIRMQKIYESDNILSTSGLGVSLEEVAEMENMLLHINIVRDTCKACWDKETGMHGSTIDYFLELLENKIKGI